MRLRHVGQVLAAVSVCLLGLPAGATLASQSAPCGTNGAPGLSEGTSTCTYTTPGSDTFNVPATVTSIIVIATGGRGGDGYYKLNNLDNSSVGGLGGYGEQVSGTTTVTGGASLNVVVAKKGSPGSQPSGGAGGVGGGGAGGDGTSSNPQGGGGGGGGASGVYNSSTPLFVAGGGGGGSSTLNDAGNGGNAGKPGQNGWEYECIGGNPGTVSAAGLGGGQSGNTTGTPVGGPVGDQGPCTADAAGSGSGSTGGTGGLGGYEASPATITAGGGGGGGGYFGGGGGQGSAANDPAGGGGGSSYAVDGSATFVIDSTDPPSVVIRYSLPTPNIVLKVKDATTSNNWSGSELSGAKAFGSALLGVTGNNQPTPTGAVTYKLFSSNDCSGSQTVIGGTGKTVANDGSVPDSDHTGALSAGTYAMRADYSGDANYGLVLSTCEPFSVNKESQTIDFSFGPPDPAVVGDTYDPEATATSSLPLTFSVDGSSDAGACSFSDPTLSFTGPGTCVLDADQAGDADWSAAPQAQQTIQVRPTSGGTITRNPAAVSAGATHRTIVFTFTAPAGGMAGGQILLTVPAGWSAPSGVSSAAGFSTSSTGSLTVNGRTITVDPVTVAAGTHVTITYGSKASGGPGTTAPTAFGNQTWTTRQKSTSIGSPESLAAQPSIAVVAADGAGTMKASIATVPHGAAHKTVQFTYKAPAGGIKGGSITLTVPQGWSAPSLAPTAGGHVTATGGGTLSVSGRTIIVSGLTRTAGQTVVIAYGSRAGGGPGATAPASPATQTWVTKERSTAGGVLTPLANPPSIKVH